MPYPGEHPARLGRLLVVEAEPELQALQDGQMAHHGGSHSGLPVIPSLAQVNLLQRQGREAGLSRALLACPDSCVALRECAVGRSAVRWLCSAIGPRAWKDSGQHQVGGVQQSHGWVWWLCHHATTAAERVAVICCWQQPTCSCVNCCASGAIAAKMAPKCSGPDSRSEQRVLHEAAMAWPSRSERRSSSSEPARLCPKSTSTSCKLGGSACVGG